MEGVLGLYMLDVASLFRHCWLDSHHPWSTACVLPCLVLCAVMWKLTFCSHVRDLNTCSCTQDLGEDKPCSYPAQTQGWRAPRDAGPGHASWRADFWSVSCWETWSLYLCGPKKHEMRSSVRMNGNLLLFGYQGTDKQAKMRLYAEEIQSINKEDVIKSLWSRMCSLSFGNASTAHSNCWTCTPHCWQHCRTQEENLSGGSDCLGWCQEKWMSPCWKGLIQSS